MAKTRKSLCEIAQSPICDKSRHNTLTNMLDELSL